MYVRIPNAHQSTGILWPLPSITSGANKIIPKYQKSISYPNILGFPRKTWFSRLWPIFLPYQNQSSKHDLHHPSKCFQASNLCKQLPIHGDIQEPKEFQLHKTLLWERN